MNSFETDNTDNMAPATTTDSFQVDTLVVVSKVKAFIKEQSGFNTGKCAIDAISQAVARECVRAIEQTREAGRKTVMGRDF